MNSPRPRYILTCGVASLIAAAASTARAQTTSTWTGATSQNWNTATNWNPPIVPDNTDTADFPGGDNVIINTATGNYPIVSSAVPSPNDINVGNGAGLAGRLDVTAGVAGQYG